MVIRGRFYWYTSRVYYYFAHLRVFHTSVSQWFHFGVWVTTSLLKSPGLLVFWPTQQCCSFNGLHSSSFFQVLLSLYQSFVDHAEYANYNWYHCHFYILQFFQLSSKVYLSFCFLSVFLCGCKTSTPVLMFFLKLKSEWQQISSGLQDSWKYLSQF